jgi:hypothetical protein
MVGQIRQGSWADARTVGEAENKEDDLASPLAESYSVSLLVSQMEIKLSTRAVFLDRTRTAGWRC